MQILIKIQFLSSLEDDKLKTDAKCFKKTFQETKLKVKTAT